MDPTIHRCLNCGVRAPDAYCPACGQSTRERLPTFAQFMREATGRYVAYDGKFWKTLAALMFRPGFLTREYLAGRRQRYIGPARLFLVSSLVLFATLRLATESINIEEAVQSDPPKEPRTKLATWALVYLAWSTRSVYAGRWLGIAVRAIALVVAYAILFAFVTTGLLIAAVLLR